MLFSVIDGKIIAMAEGNPEFTLKSFEDPSKIRFAVIVGKWNLEINKMMLDAALEAFTKQGIPGDNIDVVYVPGAFELPLVAQELADTDKYSAILCFATVIKGDTEHFDMVVEAANRGILQVTLETTVPIMNGILAVYQKDHALARAKANKGFEIAMSAMDVVQVLEQI